MSKGYLIFCVVPILVVVAGICFLWPRVFFMRDSLPGRENEPGLPKVTIEKGGVVYCRMRADDFRFPLPRGASPSAPVVESGGFDTVAGSIDVWMKEPGQLNAGRYMDSLRHKVAVGGWVTADSLPDGRLRIKFSYFGDR